MWLLFAALSALFAGATAILAKLGIRDTNSHLATALRTVVVLAFSWLMVFVKGAQTGIGDISARTYVFLILSGLTTGASWLCYFRALQTGDINKVAPIDKSSTILTMLLAFLLLGEALTPIKLVSMAVMLAGTFLMLEKKADARAATDRKWLWYALLSAVFASLTSILGKLGIQGVDSDLGTAIRTAVVLVMAWLIVFMQGRQGEIGKIDKRSWLFLILSGIATGLSWLCYYRALQTGPASVVAPIDKLSILVSIGFGALFLGERLSLKAGIGLALLTGGTLLLLL